MWIKSRVGNIISWLKTRIASSLLLRSRKASFLVFGALVLFLIWSALKLYPYRRSSRKPSAEKTHAYSALAFDEVCLANHLAKWDKDLNHDDVIITHNPLHSHESPYIPFVGNGNIGIAARKNSFLQIKETSLMEVPYEPLLEPSVSNGPEPKEATVINMKDGIIHHIHSYLWARSCIILENIVYTHRSHSSLLVQQIKVTNHAGISAEVIFKEKENKGWSKSQTQSGSVTVKSNHVNYDVHQGNVAFIDDNHPGVNVTIVTTKTPKTLHIEPGRASTEHVHVAIVHTSINLQQSPHNIVDMTTLLQQAEKDFQLVLEKDPHTLRSTHEQTWNKLWRTGIHVNPRHDPDTPPGIEVNATMYYILSTYPSPDYDKDGKPKDVEEFESLLHAPEHCFGGPPTMHSASLWPIPRTEAAVSRMMLAWKQVLTQNGCSSLLKAGATGIAQAMALSFGGLQFAAGLFEFAANPASLHTSVTFRHIHLYKGVYINVSVVINDHTGHAEKLLIKANVGDGKTPLYACEAGCQYEPVELGLSQVVFPVRMTKPVTPILYISKNKSQLQNIKKNVFIKDAHQESLRHHHVFHHVGLPAKFWVSIVFLIVAFHLYLVKLIYYECFKEPVRSKVYIS